MAHKRLRTGRPRSKQRRGKARYSPVELMLAGVGVLILVLAVVLIITALAGAS